MTTTAEALKRLNESLNATNVLNEDYKRHITGWAYKAVEVAWAEGFEKGRESMRQQEVPEQCGEPMGDRGVCDRPKGHFPATPHSF